MGKILMGFLGLCLIGICAFPGAVFAENSEVAVLKAQIDALSRKLEAMDSKMMTMEKPAPGAQTTYIPPAPDEKGGLLRTAMEDIHMGGYVETQYQNKLGEPQQNGNVGRSLTDKAADTFSMNAAKLWFEKAANPEGGAGFRIDMMMGSDVRYYFNNFQKDNAGNDSTTSSTAFAFEQAYVQFIAPLGFWANNDVLPHSIDIKAGRMVTLAGNEVIEGPNNWNISRSADILGIDRVTLYNKINKYGLQRESS